MAHPYHHALSSVKKWGGSVDDFEAIHAWLDVIRTIKLFLFSWPGFVVVVHRRAPAARVARIRAQRSGRRGGTCGLPRHFPCRFSCLSDFLGCAQDWLAQFDEKLLDAGGYP
jgi:hypothetical protein